MENAVPIQNSYCKIPINPFVCLLQQHLFAAEKVKVCFANIFLLPHTYPQQNDTQAGIRDIT